MTIAAAQRLGRMLRHDLPVEPFAHLAAFVPGSFERAKRQVAVVCYGGEEVLRSGLFSDPWYLRLSLEPGAMLDARFKTGLPVLHEHGDTKFSMPQVGVASDHRIETLGGSKRSVATVTFSDRKIPGTDVLELEALLHDVETGILKGLSYGVQFHRMRQVRPATFDADGNPVQLALMVAELWEAMELSVLAVQASPSAVTLNANQAPLGRRCVVVIGSAGGAQLAAPDGRAIDLSKRSLKGAAAAAAVAAANGGPAGDGGGGAAAGAALAAAADPAGGDAGDDDEGDGGEGDAPPARPAAAAAPVAAPAAAAAPAGTKLAGDATQAGVALERQRQRAIRLEAARHGLTAGQVDELIDQGLELGAAKGRMLDLVEARTAKGPRGGAISVGPEVRDHLRAGLEEAILLRCGGKRPEATDASRPFRGLTLLEAARVMLRRNGVEEPPSRDKLVQMALAGAHGVDDFPLILANVQQKRLQAGYEMAPRTFMPLAAEADRVDFKEGIAAAIGLGGQFEEMLSDQQSIRYVTFGEHGEKYAVKTYAAGIAFGRKALINDDLKALDSVPESMGKQAASLENRIAWSFITGNVVLNDTVALFDATTHKNDLASGSDFALAADQKSMTAMREKLRLQTDPDGNILNLRPDVLIVPAKLETIGRQQTSLVNTPSSAANINTFQGTQLIVEPLLDGVAGGGTRHFMACLAAQLAVFEIAYLSGNRLPTITSEASFDQLVVKTKAVHDVGLAPINHRAIVRSNGLS